MDNFAFIIHPLDVRVDIDRKFKLLSRLPVAWLHFISGMIPPMLLSHITGIRSEGTGNEIEGWFVACPMTPRRMVTLNTESAIRRIVRAGRLARHVGARIVGLGGFTSVVGDAGVTVAKRLALPTTTGNTLTVAATLRALYDVARREGVDIESSTAAVVGGSGAIGRACAVNLAGRVSRIVLAGRSKKRLQEVAAEIQTIGRASVVTACDLSNVREAGLVVVASSAQGAILFSEHVAPGALVCDVARPLNVAKEVRHSRPDVRVVNGGMLRVPGDVDFGFDFGLPPQMAFACMAEAMILAIEGRYENYTLGRRISAAKVSEMGRLARRHGFRVVPG